jgi:predicted metal-dependent phosphoesterase TrpH
MGIPISEEDVKAASCGGTLYKQHIMKTLLEMGWVDSTRGSLFEKMFGKNGIAKYTDNYLPAEKAISIVTEAGGLPVLAHPYRYDTVDLIPKLVESGLGGIEIWHVSTVTENIFTLMIAAEKYGLFMTGGSDYHGSNLRVPQRLYTLKFPEDNPVLAPLFAK